MQDTSPTYAGSMVGILLRGFASIRVQLRFVAQHSQLAQVELSYVRNCVWGSPNLGDNASFAEIYIKIPDVMVESTEVFQAMLQLGLESIARADTTVRPPRMVLDFALFPPGPM